MRWRHAPLLAIVVPLLIAVPALAAGDATPAAVGVSQVRLAAAPLPLQGVPAEADLLLFARAPYEPGVRERLDPAEGPWVAVVEEGALTVRAGGPVVVVRTGAIADPATPAVEAEFRLGAGEAVAVPAGTAVELRNDEGAPAAALVAGVFASGGDWGWAGPDPNPWQPLGLGMPDALPGSAAAVLERVTIGPGAATTRAAPGPEVVVVEAGALALGVERGRADAYPVDFVRSHPVGPGQDRVGKGGTARLATGDAALVHAGTQATLGNADDEPLVLLVLTILTGDAGTRTPAIGTPRP